MSPPDPSGPWPGCGGYDHDHILESFEDAWRKGQKPVLAEFVPLNDLERETRVEELALLDLEYRIKRGEQARVEPYVRAFPFLGEWARVVKLIGTEFKQRLRCEAGVSAGEYARRFPAVRERVSSRLSRLASPARNGTPAEFVCSGLFGRSSWWGRNGWQTADRHSWQEYSRRSLWYASHFVASVYAVRAVAPARTSAGFVVRRWPCRCRLAPTQAPGRTNSVNSRVRFPVFMRPYLIEGVAGYGTTEFDMSPARMDQLVDAGRDAMTRYLGPPGES